MFMNSKCFAVVSALLVSLSACSSDNDKKSGKEEVKSPSRLSDTLTVQTTDKGANEEFSLTASGDLNLSVDLQYHNQIDENLNTSDYIQNVQVPLCYQAIAADEKLGVASCAGTEETATIYGRNVNQVCASKNDESKSFLVAEASEAISLNCAAGSKVTIAVFEFDVPLTLSDLNDDSNK